MKAEDLATLITPKAGLPDLGFHMGQVLAWNSSTGENAVSVLSTTIDDVPVLSTSDSILLAVGDTVALLRFKSTYFILGRISTPGDSRALGIQSVENGGVINPTTTSYAAYAGSPVLTNVAVGSSRRLLVWVDSTMSVANNTGQMSVSISGASSPGIPDGALLTSNTVDTIQASVSRIFYFDASDTLASGLHTITGVAKRTSNVGGAVSMLSGVMTALPF